MRESELRYREVQTELAHANRVATMGQLTASIAHEVGHPVAATLTNAETAARWLAREPPDLARAKQSIDRIIGDSKRAANIFSGIRDLVKSAPSQVGRCGNQRSDIGGDRARPAVKYRKTAFRCRWSWRKVCHSFTAIGSNCNR